MPFAGQALAPHRARSGGALEGGLARLMVSGGDGRIAPDAATGRNAYFGRPVPDARILAFGSCTASTVGPRGWDAAERLRARSAARGAAGVRAEASRIRAAVARACGARPDDGVDTVLAASGTDAHLIAAQLVAAAAEAPLFVLAPAPGETGRGAPAALAGRHFAATTALGLEVAPGAPLAGAAAPEVVGYALRDDEGRALADATVERTVARAIAGALAQGRRVLLVAVDGSKTGRVAPSPDALARLERAFGDGLTVLVDACQMRLSRGEVATHLDAARLVAVTGSKFAAGPSFSGALLVPREVAWRLREARAPAGLAAYTTRADWPDGWAAAHGSSVEANLGLLLRWEAALAELEALHALAPGQAAGVAVAIGRALAAHAARLEGLDLAAAPGASPTLWMLRPAGADGRAVGGAAAARIHRTLALGEAGLHAEIGQPVTLGADRVALRLALGARQLAAAATPAGLAHTIADGCAVLDAVVALSSSG